MATRVTLVPGDGIGPGITDATLRILAAAGAEIEWDWQVAGMAAVREHGDPMPQSTPESIRQTRLALKGPLETPVGGGYRSSNVALRKTFDLYANVRPARTIRADGRFEHVDVGLIRENTEGLYSGVERYIKVGDDPRTAAESIAIITRSGSERIIRYAFEYAARHGRRKVTVVHKANILEFSTGLFLEVAAVEGAIRDGRTVTRDLGGTATTDVFADAIVARLG